MILITIAMLISLSHSIVLSPIVPAPICSVAPIRPRHTATPKAMRTSPQPGLTRALSTRLKLSQDPLLYAFDTPGIMLPFLGRGERGAERGIKLALIGM